MRCKNFGKTLLTAAAFVMTALAPALAERMSGQDVAALLGKGRVEFQAGSIWTTLSANTYRFMHRNSSEAGTFKIFGNGDVEILDQASGSTMRFYFDRGADGVPALIYLTGAGTGKRYPIK